MEFDPRNAIVRLCLQGIAEEEKGLFTEASKTFLQAWNEASSDFERFLAAYYLARRQTEIRERLKWLETATQLASNVDDPSATSALPALYARMAECHEASSDPENAERFRRLSAAAAKSPQDGGPFYHGTRADLHVGDLLTPGGESNYQPGLAMNHVYFTALPNGAGLAAALARGEGRERVYVVTPTGPFESDPNVTDKKFPGNPTRSYRSSAPLKIIGELTDWARQTPEQIRAWRERLAAHKGEIIN